MAKGKFITLEGGEGAGKSTQARLLADWLASRGIAALVTREPGGTPLAESIRHLLLGAQDGPADALTDALLFNAARRDHALRLIRPALEAGKWVICDRFADSTRAYQGAGGALDGSTVQRLEDWVTADTRPDLTLILDLPEHLGLQRAAARHHAISGVGTAGRAVAGASPGRDRFEAADSAFHLRLRLMFLRIAQSEPERCAVIDAEPSADAVSLAVRAVVADRLRA